jgi:ABC-type bacteriocin/lantibiotic exporter with double-glycine peptidase domain
MLHRFFSKLRRAPGLCVLSLLLATAARGQDYELDRFYQPNDCGPIALFVICQLLDVETTLTEIRELSGLHSGGTSIAGLTAAAKEKGLEPTALNSSISHLQRLRGPSIVDFPKGHFCVFLGWKADKAVVFDLPGRKRVVDIATLEKQWGKHVITFSKPR